jgi:hypothetical protein
MHLEPHVGNNGTFYYPKQDLIATTMVVTDLDELSTAEPGHREAIFTIRQNLDTTRLETLRGKNITINYQTLIKGLERWSLKESISQAYINYSNAKPDKTKANFPFT